MQVTTRQAGPDDAALLAALLNEIIAIGGTTAYETPFSDERFLGTFIDNPLRISCAVADIGGVASGFQYLGHPSRDDYPVGENWAFIASFVKPGLTGRGIGGALWEITRTEAGRAGIVSIDATIRADNALGLGFYSRLGFTDYGVFRARPLRDGTPVDRIRKRYDL